MNQRIILVVAMAGIVAAFFAVVLNLAEGGTTAAQRNLAIDSVIAGVIALSCAIWVLRKGGTWRWWAMAAGGPALFAIADAGMRVVLFLRQ